MKETSFRTIARLKRPETRVIPQRRQQRVAPQQPLILPRRHLARGLLQNRERLVAAAAGDHQRGHAVRRDEALPRELLEVGERAPRLLLTPGARVAEPDAHEAARVLPVLPRLARLGDGLVEAWQDGQD